MNTITDDQIAEIEALADKATGGEWEYNLGIIRTMVDSDGYVLVAIAPNCPRNWRKQRDRNMDYIASANPASILSLITRLHEAERDAERYRWLRETASGAPEDFEVVVCAAFAAAYGCDHNFDLNIDEAMQDAKQ